MTVLKLNPKYKLFGEYIDLLKWEVHRRPNPQVRSYYIGPQPRVYKRAYFTTPAFLNTTLCMLVDGNMDTVLDTYNALKAIATTSRRASCRVGQRQTGCRGEEDGESTHCTVNETD